LGRCRRGLIYLWEGLLSPRMAKRKVPSRDLFSNNGLYPRVLSPDHWVMRANSVQLPHGKLRPPTSLTPRFNTRSQSNNQHHIVHAVHSKRFLANCYGIDIRLLLRPTSRQRSAKNALPYGSPTSRQAKLTACGIFSTCRLFRLSLAGTTND
jgi:hypothetical protein